VLNSFSFSRLFSVFVFSIAANALLAGPQFLTLPFSNPKVFLRQGWAYDTAGDFLCSDFPAAIANRCHKGIDYFCVENDSVTSFEILAAAGGKAVATYSKSGYGYLIFIAHDQVDEKGQHIFTLYAHVKEGSWTVPLRTLDQFRNEIQARDFSDWKSVERGDKIAMAGKSGGQLQIHLHFEVQLDGYAVNKADPYDIYGFRDDYSSPCTPSALFPSEQSAKYPSSFWTECPPISPQTSVVLQADSKDIWTTSVYSYAACSGSFPGGGLNDEQLRVGGWGDLYYSLLQFDLTGRPANVQSAFLYLYCFNQSGGGTPMYLDRITEYWNWQTEGTGCDHLRLWWADRPTTVQWISGQIPNATAGQWYSVDITDLYNAWKGSTPNYGLELRPVNNFNNNFNEFYSSDYSDDPSLRPKLVITP
jgi:hypothetical protein